LELHLHYERWVGRQIDELDREILKNYRLPRVVEVPSFVRELDHLFALGYGAGYYSYYWAEVLDADAFTLFQKKGVLNEELGRRFRYEVLAKGATEPADVLFRRFMGRDPDPTAFLLRHGIRVQPK
jgi:oligopeptidase A